MQTRARAKRSSLLNLSGNEVRRIGKRTKGATRREGGNLSFHLVTRGPFWWVGKAERIVTASQSRTSQMFGGGIFGVQRDRELEEKRQGVCSGIGGV